MMSGMGQVLINVVSATAMRVISAALSFAFFVIIARQRDPAFVGAFSTIFTLFAFSQMLPLLGLHLSLVRDAARPGADIATLAANALIIGLVATAGLGVMLGLVGETLYPQDIHGSLWLVAACLPFHASMLVGDSMLIGRERLALVALINGGESLLRVSGWIVIVILGGGLTALSMWMFAARVLAVGFHRHWGGLHHLSFRTVSWAGITAHLRTIPVFLGIALAAAIIARLDSLLLPLVGGLEALAIYMVAFKVYEAALMVPQSLSMALFPTIARLQAGPADAFTALMSQLLGLTLLLGLPCALLVAAFVDGPFLLVFGQGYADSVIVIRVLIFATVLVAADQIMSAAMLAAKHQNLDLAVLVTAGIGGVILLMTLIPVYGHLGAAVGVLSMISLQVTVRSTLLRRSIRLDYLHIVWPPALAAGAMALVLVTGQSWPWNWRLLGASAAFLFTAWALGQLKTLHPARLRSLLPSRHAPAGAA